MWSVRYRGVTRFTLLEMLVVVSIITVLAAILLPALTRARRTAFQATCSNNFKQFGLGLAMYAEDQGDWLPAGRTLVSTFILAGHAKELATYGVDRNVVTCPEYPEAAGGVFTGNKNLPIWPGTSTDAVTLPYYYFGGDGFANNLWGQNDVDGNPWYGWSISSNSWHRAKQGVRPTPRFQLNENFATIAPIAWDTTYKPDETAHGFNRSRHSNHLGSDGFSGRGFNMLYADLHVEWRPLTNGYGPDLFHKVHYR